MRTSAETRYLVATEAHPLARQFFALAAKHRVSLTAIAERAGIGRGTVVHWRRVHAPTVPALEAALNVLGYELVIRERDGNA